MALVGEKLAHAQMPGVIGVRQRVQDSGVEEERQSTPPSALGPRFGTVGSKLTPKVLLVMSRDVLPPAMASPEEAQGEGGVALLFVNEAGEGFAHQSGDGNSSASCHHVEFVVHSFVDEYSGSLHMTYSSIYFSFSSVSEEWSLK